MLRFILALVLLASPAAAQQRRYAIADFERVVIEGPFAVTLAVGPPSSAIGTGSAQALERVSVDVQGTTLRIRPNRSAWGGTPGQAPAPATIALTTRNLRSARIIGGGQLALKGARGLRLDLLVEGNGQLTATALASDAVTLGLRGAGSITAAGQVEAVTADIQGNGSLDASGLRSETLTLFAATTGDVSLTARRSATVTANGLGRVEIAGTRACTLRGPGAAAVSCGPVR
jgi:hypothetical protein